MASAVNRSLLWIRLILFPWLFLNCGSVVADERPFAPPSIPGAVSVSAEEAVELILAKPDLVIIDARLGNEYAKGHIEGSVNLLNTMRREELEAVVPDRSTPIIFYCNGERCLRSSDAVNKAMAWGYRNLYWFRGGWKEWTDKGLPVIVE
jgi:rhodanese-related sulfurtransferase